MWMLLLAVMWMLLREGGPASLLSSAGRSLQQSPSVLCPARTGGLSRVAFEARLAMRRGPAPNSLLSPCPSTGTQLRCG